MNNIDTLAAFQRVVIIFQLALLTWIGGTMTERVNVLIETTAQIGKAQ